MNNQTSTAIPIILTAFLSGCASISENTAFHEYDNIKNKFYNSASTTAAPKYPDENSTVDNYINHAFLVNPELKAAFNRWKASLEQARQAGYLDDPSLTFEKAIDEVDLDYRVAISQKIPWYGKRSLLKKAKIAGAEEAMYEFETVKLELYMKVVMAFNEYQYLGRVTSVTSDNLKLLTDMEAAVRARYESGKAEFSDLIKVQVEMDKLKNELSTLQDQRLVRSNMLAALLDLKMDKALPWPKMQLLDQTDIPDDVLFDMLRDLNPELKAMDSMLEKKKLSLDLARKTGWPDFVFGASWMAMPENDAGEHMTDTGLMAGITLPIWRGKYSAERKEAEAMYKAVFNKRKDLTNRLKVELRTALFKSKDALRRIKLFEDSLLPKAKQALEVTRKDYASGKANFMSLIDAQRTLLEFTVMHVRALADREIAIAEIGCCVGKYQAPGESTK
ncbi:TolC family protein [Verrucomicrobiota bacterium]